MPAIGIGCQNPDGARITSLDAAWLGVSWVSKSSLHELKAGSGAKLAK
jgi:hypothetical protein